MTEIKKLNFDKSIKEYCDVDVFKKIGDEECNLTDINGNHFNEKGIFPVQDNDLEKGLNFSFLTNDENYKLIDQQKFKMSYDTQLDLKKAIKLCHSSINLKDIQLFVTLINKIIDSLKKNNIYFNNNKNFYLNNSRDFLNCTENISNLLTNFNYLTEDENYILIIETILFIQSIKENIIYKKYFKEYDLLNENAKPKPIIENTNANAKPIIENTNAKPIIENTNANAKPIIENANANAKPIIENENESKISLNIKKMPLFKLEIQLTNDGNLSISMSTFK